MAALGAWDSWVGSKCLKVERLARGSFLKDTLVALNSWFTDLQIISEAAPSFYKRVIPL